MIARGINDPHPHGPHGRACSRIIIPLSLWLAVCATPALGDVDVWSSSGPGGGDVRLVAVAPTTPTTVFAATAMNGLFRSTDAGEAWRHVNELATTALITAFAIDPLTPTTAYLGTRGNGIFRSINAGASWDAASAGLGDLFVLALAIDPNTPTNLYAGTDAGGLFRSSDGGNSWHAANNGLANAATVFALAIDPANTNILYAGTDGSGVLKSTDSGTSWSDASSGLLSHIIRALSIDPGNSETIYATGARGLTSFAGVFKSTDGGATWETGGPAASSRPAIKSNPENAFVNRFAIDPVTTTTVYAATSPFVTSAGIVTTGGVFKSTDSGTSWRAANTGLASSTVGALVAGHGAIYAAAPGGVFTSTDRGGNWHAANTGFLEETAQVHSLAVDPSDPMTVYAGVYWQTADGSDAGGFFKSTNRSASWNRVDLGTFPFVPTVVAIDPRSSAVLYAAAQRWVFKSVDGGRHWRGANPLGPGATPPNAFAIDPTDSLTVYTGTEVGVFKSTNGAASWSAVSAGLIDPWVTSLAINPAIPTVLYAGTRSRGVFKTTDGGLSWNDANRGLTNAAVRAILLDSSDPTLLYVGVARGGVFRSTNGGSNWEPFDTGLTNSVVNALAIDAEMPTVLYAATQGGGVFAIEPSRACTGDCDGDGNVTVNELVTGWNIALGETLLSACPTFDVSGDAEVSIDEIVIATNHLLQGCPSKLP